MTTKLPTPLGAWRHLWMAPWWHQSSIYTCQIKNPFLYNSKSNQCSETFCSFKFFSAKNVKFPKIHTVVIINVNKKNFDPEPLNRRFLNNGQVCCIQASPLFRAHLYSVLISKSIYQKVSSNLNVFQKNILGWQKQIGLC